MKILPSIKDKDNIKWLMENEETFLVFMSQNHSAIDLAHTYLYFDTFNDAYLKKIRAKIAASDQKIEDELKKRKAAPKPKKTTKKKTAVEKKIEVMEKAAEKVENDKFAEEELFED
jgi:hypothetical protein